MLKNIYRAKYHIFMSPKKRLTTLSSAVFAVYTSPKPLRRLFNHVVLSQLITWWDKSNPTKNIFVGT